MLFGGYGMSDHRIIFNLVVIVAVAFFSSGLTSFPAHADDAWTITNGKGGRCLDAANPEGLTSLPNGTRVGLWDCNGSANQVWTGGTIFLLNAAGGRCLDAADPTNATSLLNGTLVGLWDCHVSGPPNQVWTISGRNIINGAGGRCLDAFDPTNATSLPNGTPVGLWDCHGGENQAWTLVEAAPVHCNPSFSSTGPIRARLVADPGTAHGLGCPTGPVTQHPNDSNGQIQNFQHGSAAFSPNTGAASVQIVYARNDGILHFVWGPTNPFNYDMWIVRYDRDGTNIGQDDVCRGPDCLKHSTGWWWSRGDLGSGLFRLIVQGCDEGNFSTTCNQGWSLPVFVNVP